MPLRLARKKLRSSFAEMNPTYLEQVSAAWKGTAVLAALHKATDIQLEAIISLSREFGKGSGHRLIDLWQVTIDKDGDVVLLFSLPCANAPWTRVVIDSYGVITMKNHHGKEWMYHPDDERAKGMFPSKERVWLLNMNLMQDLIEPAYKFDEERGLAYISDLRRWVSSFEKAGTYRSIWATSWDGGPISGFALPAGGGRMVFYELKHEDLVTNVRFYAIFKMSGLDCLKAWTDWLRIKLCAKLKLNPPKKWLFSTSRYSAGKVPIAYTVL